MENQQNNFTVGTTFWKWFLFGSGKTIALIFLIGVPTLCIIWREEAITGIGSLFFGVVFPLLILIALLVSSSIDWNHEKAKLK